MNGTDAHPGTRPEEALERLRHLLARQRAGDVQDALADLRQALQQQQAREDALRRRVEQLDERCQAAQDAMARYRELFEFAPDCYFVTDLAGNVREANQAAVVRFGRAREFLVDKPLPFFAAPEERPGFYGRLARLAVQPSAARAWDLKLQGPRGTTWDGALSVTVVLDADGRPESLRWLIRDVTRARRAEDELRGEKAFAESVIDMADAAVLVTTPEGEVVRVNAYLERLCGRRREELLGRHWAATLLPEAEQAAAQAQLFDAPEPGPARSVRRLRTRDGGLRTIAWSARRLTDVRRAAPPVVLVGHDISELQESQERALRLERLAAIGQMAAGLAHESRNALQRGQACLERLRWALHGQPNALDLVARARAAQDDLVRLYEDVREYAAPIKLECRPCDVAAVWREVWAELLAVSPGRVAHLEEALATADPRAEVDRFRLAQVFRNLLDNALAAAPDPGWVQVHCADATLGDRPALRVAVRDNGPGLNAEQRQHLFEPFYTTKTRGTGLGMAIARRLVEAHGGQIAIADNPPPGAEILITLPRRQS
jgi:PAS domain S-box-containing protein